jgi:tetratricopeptide (TPR) repeat protein
MKKEQLAFLIGGLAFGILIGFGVYHTVYTAPQLAANAAMPAGVPSAGGAPSAPPAGASTAAPMVAEINQLKRTVSDDPDNLEAWVRLGNLHYDVQMWDQAASYYERAVELAPNNPDVITDLGVCYRGMQQFERALEAFERAHQADPTHVQSLFNTVIVAGFDLGQLDRAEQALEALEAMQPQPPRLGELRHALEQMRAQGGAQPGGAS